MSAKQNWLERVSMGTRRDYAYTFDRFMIWKNENGGKFADMTPDQMIEYQRNAENGNGYELLDLTQRWILSLEGLAYKTKRTYYMAIQSFFIHNRVEMPKDKSFKIRGDKPKTPSNLRPEHVKQAVLVANPMYGALITCMIGGGIGVAEILEWSRTGWKSLRTQLDEEKEIVKVELPGRKSEKNIRPYFTLIGGDSVRMLKHYLGSDLSEKRKAIFLNPLGKPVNATALKHFWLRHLIRIGIIDKEDEGTKGTRYGYGLHELRDNFRTLWSQSRANPDVGEFLMGHRIDAYEYNQIYRDYDYVVEEYRQALPFLNVLSGGFNPERNEEVNTLQDEITKLKGKIAELKADQQANQLTPEQQAVKDQAMEDRLYARFTADVKARRAERDQPSL